MPPEATGITLSRHQYAHVTKLIEQRGLAHRVRMLLADYRALPENEPFDKIASIGMFEHVGYKNYRAFMKVVRRCLKPDGLFLLHTIGTETTRLHLDGDAHLLARRSQPDFAPVGPGRGVAPPVLLRHLLEGGPRLLGRRFTRSLSGRGVHRREGR